jgi:predicted glycosyltransferase
MGAANQLQGITMQHGRRPLWIDLDNSPHVPFFRPIIEVLRQRGYPVVITARDAFQVSELTRLYGITCFSIGRHYGKNRYMKLLGLVVRAMQLLPLIIRAKPRLAISHGSRAQTLVAKLLGIPSIIIADYEHATHLIQPDWAIVPEVIPRTAAEKIARRVLTYPGIKEDVYAADSRLDLSLPAELGLAKHEIVVVVRPPATEAHYHNPESETLFASVMEFLGNAEGTRSVLLPRNARQAAWITQRWPEWLRSGKMIIPKRAVEGMNLIHNSDLVISGGGTMNREAAALGVPVYSIFRGKLGAVDRYLAEHGRLTLISPTQDISQQILLVKRNPTDTAPATGRSALESIVNGIISTLDPWPGASPISSPELGESLSPNGKP